MGKLYRIAYLVLDYICSYVQQIFGKDCKTKATDTAVSMPTPMFEDD